MLETCACCRRVSLLNSRKTSGTRAQVQPLESPPVPASLVPNRRRRVFLPGVSMKWKIVDRVRLPYSQFSALVFCCPLWAQGSQIYTREWWFPPYGFLQHQGNVLQWQRLQHLQLSTQPRCRLRQDCTFCASLQSPKWVKPQCAVLVEVIAEAETAVNRSGVFCWALESVGLFTSKKDYLVYESIRKTKLGYDWLRMIPRKYTGGRSPAWCLVSAL